MTRSYRKVRVKKDRVYSVDELMELFSVTRNTVSNWRAHGLKASDDQRPLLFRGDVVARFHVERRAQSSQILEPGQFKCFGCKSAVFPDARCIIQFTGNGSARFEGECPDCGKRISKLWNETDRDIFDGCRNPIITQRSPHERMVAVPSGIGISEGSEVPKLILTNDRLIHDWMVNAGRYAEKTIDKHLASIRFCEKVVGDKPFGSYTKKDVARVRDALKSRQSSAGDELVSQSYVRHRASELRTFFQWLLKQKGYGRLPKDLPEYLELPRALRSPPLPKSGRAYPSIEDAEEMLEAMPKTTVLDRRARAIFAIAFLGALRSDTVVSLRLQSLDVVGRRIIQDASVVRAKNGKNEIVAWFPLPPVFGVAVVDWLTEMTDRGLSGKDALFPGKTNLELPWKLTPVDRGVIEPMTTAHAVSQAFSTACQGREVRYTPHSAKHTIAAERDRRPLTHEERKAWSENMGHETEKITEAHYGKLPTERRMELIHHACSKGRGLRQLTGDEKIALVDEIASQLGL